MGDKSPTNEAPSENNKKLSDQMLDKATATYKWWNNLATLNDEDPIAIFIAKLSIRILGILFLIMMSPVIIIALLIAFIAVI